MAGATLALYTSADTTVDEQWLAGEAVEHRPLHNGEPPPDGQAGIWLVDARLLGDTPEAVSQAVARLADRPQLRVVLVADEQLMELAPEADQRVFGYLQPDAPPRQRERLLRSAMQSARAMQAQAQLADDLKRRDKLLQELNEIGAALSAEHNIDRLLETILDKARQLTGADAGSLYLIESPSDSEPRLRFKLSQNDSLDLDYSEFTIPLNTRSLSGYTGVTGQCLRLADVYDLPSDVDYSFSRSWDEEHGYRTKSMLVVPMKNNKGDVRGVLQLINHKPDVRVRLETPEVVEREVTEFPPEHEDLAESLASQAAVALENQLLLNNISNIFEGFLMGWVEAVEDRDPATAGHSQRVTALTLALAREVDKAETGPFADVHFSEQDYEELRYAGLLHDIGKIYVRAEVFLKAKKLYTDQLKLIQERFDFVRRTLEAEYNRRKLEYMLQNPTDRDEEAFKRIDREHSEELQVLDDYFQIVLMANEPTVMDEHGFERINEIAGKTYKDIYGHTQHLLQPEELRLLTIRRGNLDESERKEIESHVEWSYRILERIPWSEELSRIPPIARAHHEKLDGSGYPLGLTADEIPLQSKMMIIADIYDALTAADRPYKKAQPSDRALRILEFERNDGHIDADLLQLFVDRGVHTVAHMDDVEQLVDRLVHEDVL